MARQPRIEYEGAFYHVTSRGNLKQNIFFQEADRRRYIEVLTRIKERYGYILHAYVLMDNHYHLLIETPLPNLNQLMQNLNTSYTVFVNKKYQRSGHLFQGRYKAILVEKDSYLLSLSRYIHLNPVRSGIVDLPEKYRWSSYRNYIGYARTEIVDMTDTLHYFSEDAQTAVSGYKNFVESGIGDIRNPFKEVQAGFVLGDKNFVEEQTRGIAKHKGADRELPALTRLLDASPIQQVVEAVADYYSLSPHDLTKRVRTHSRERKLAIFLSKILTRGKHSFVGDYFGIKPQAVTNALTEVEDNLAESESLRREIEEIKCKM
jgi:REP element-mobilizing transposase RayT